MDIVDASDDQVGSQDEYEIALAEGIEDEALQEDRAAPKNFAITSYGADYTVDGLVKRMRSGAFIIPEFQRRFVWSHRHASKFIESLLMGLPVPGLFLYKEADTNKHLVIDGQQRLRTLRAFYDGVLGDRKFRLLAVREPWNDKAYSELDTSDQLKIDDSIIHATIFRQDEPTDVLDSIYFVFERINSGGIRLSPQEIRNCVAAGPFTDMVERLNNNSDWRKIFGGKVNKRSKDQELIVRFFALAKASDHYARPMAKFLNDFSAQMNKASPELLTDLENIFVSTVALVNKSLGARAFRPARSLNAAVFDAVMTGLSSRLGSGEAPTPSAVAQAYDKLLANDDFRKAWIRATADEETVKSRLKLAREAFQLV